MSSINTHRLVEFLAGIHPMMALFWLCLAVFTVVLAVLLYTRWGQYKPLRKCMALSILVHAMLASYAATIQIIMPLPPRADPINVTFDGYTTGDGTVLVPSDTNERPWELFSREAEIHATDLVVERAKADRPAPPERIVRAGLPELPIEPSLDDVALDGATIVEPSGAIGRLAGSIPAAPALEKIAVPPPQRREAASVVPSSPVTPERVKSDRPARPVRIANDDLPVALLRQFATLPPPTVGDDMELPGIATTSDSPKKTSPRPLREVIFGQADGGTDSAYSSGVSATVGGKSASTGPGRANVELTGNSRTAVEAKPLPDVYRLRVAPNRPIVARGNGGTAETEAAVAAALKWLADNQDADGRWNPRTCGGGKETKVLGRDRLGAGSHADSAVTGLALLAFQASGNTHLDGTYCEDVRRGLKFLLRTQAADGNLGGDAAAFEFMYSHAMAACALSEAYGMTRDSRLREPVRRAVAYTLAAQDPAGGGWRYRPGDPGDTSQLGWQLMTLKSAELAGISIPETTRQGIVRYLRSVSSGRNGGRAAYRPGESPSRSMTAEALVCWQFLGLTRQHPACNEAGDFILEQTPGEGEFNLYYWYYATLGMYQLGGTHWQRWNDAMRDAVVSRQVKEGPHAGSWNTDSLWGGYGGRVYTTSLATLTLEVYYRFLPLYAEVARGDNRIR